MSDEHVFLGVVGIRVPKQRGKGSRAACSGIHVWGPPGIEYVTDPDAFVLCVCVRHGGIP